MAISRSASNVVLPILAVAGALGVSAIAGLTVGQERLPSTLLVYLPFGIAALGIAGLSLRELGDGVALLPFIAAAVPLTIGTGTQSPIVAALLFTVFLLGVWVLQRIFAHDLAIVRSPINLPLLALMLVWIIAYLYSDVDRSPMVWLWESFRLPRLGQLGIVLVSGAVFLLAVNHGRKRRYLELATWSFVALGVPAVAAFYLGREQTVWFLSTGGLFTMWGCTLAYGQALFNERLPIWGRVALVGLVVAWLVKATVLQTIWFSGWLPSLVAVAILTLLRSRKAFVVLVVLTTAAVLLNADAVQHALWDAKVDEGDLSRVPIWAQAWELLRSHLLLGTGPAGYAAYYITIFRGSSFSMSTHSNYVDFVAETGVIGAAITLWFFLTLLVVGWQARQRWRTGFVGGYAQAAFAGLLGLFVAMSLGDWFIPFVYNQTIAGFRYTIHSWVFLGYLASLAATSPDREVT